METYDDRIEWLEEQSVILGKDMARIDITVKTSDGTPIQGVLLSGVTTMDERPVYTDQHGSAKGYTKTRSIAVGVYRFVDLEDKRITVVNEAGQKYNADIITDFRNYYVVKSTNTFYFTPYAKHVKYSVCGGGGGGGQGGNNSGNNPGLPGGGGGGGYGVLGELIPTPNTGYPVSVGSGGTASTSMNVAGGNGGSSSFNATSANGGKGGGGSGSDNGAIGGVGNGNGGNGGTLQTGTNGYPGTNPWYVAYNTVGVCGGGGGGCIYDTRDTYPYPHKYGGSPNGGSGGNGTNYNNYGYLNATAGKQPGGGGGGGINRYGSEIASYSANGGNGACAFSIDFE